MMNSNAPEPHIRTEPGFDETWPGASALTTECLLNLGFLGSRMASLGESLVRRCVTEEARRLLGTPENPPPVRILGLDEFSIKKGQVYDTAIIDIEERQILGVVSGHRQ